MSLTPYVFTPPCRQEYVTYDCLYSAICTNDFRIQFLYDKGCVCIELRLYTACGHGRYVALTVLTDDSTNTCQFGHYSTSQTIPRLPTIFSAYVLHLPSCHRRPTSALIHVYDMHGDVDIAMIACNLLETRIITSYLIDLQL